jgi:hypothetical protein
MAVGAFLAWSCERPRHTVSWAGVSASGALLLAAVSAGAGAEQIISIGGVAWALSMAVLVMAAGLTRAGLKRRAVWWGIPQWIAAAALLGLPLTLGFTTMAFLVGGLVAAAHVGSAVAFVLTQAFLVPALVRWLMLPAASPPPRARPFAILWAGGVGLLAILLTLAGIVPSLRIGAPASHTFRTLLAIPGLPGWLVWGVSLALGGVLAWQERSLRPKIEHLLGVIHDLWRLEWLYGATGGALDRGLSVFRAADDMIGGTGALLWSMLLFVILVLVWSN